MCVLFVFQAEDGIRDGHVTGVQTCALPISKKALDSFLGNVKTALKDGERVSLVGFGTWSVSERAAREGRNPQTGKTIKIAAKNVVKFKPGSELQNSVN